MQNLEWLNQNALRAYPLQEDMPRHPVVDGAPVLDIQLPNSFILDFAIAVSDAADVWLSKLVLAGNFISLSFSSAAASVIATAAVDTSAYSEDAAIPLPLLPVSGQRLEGKIVVGNLTELRRVMPDGIYDFTPDQTLFEFCLVYPTSAQLAGVQVVDNQNVSELLGKVIRLVAGRNTRLTYDPVDRAIIFSAVPGEGYFADCGECAVTDNIVRTINGIPLADVEIVSGNECIDITTSGNTIKITDKCSTPCCGCQELEAVTTALTQFDARTTDIETYRTNLESAIRVLSEALAVVSRNAQ